MAPWKLPAAPNCSPCAPHFQHLGPHLFLSDVSEPVIQPLGHTWGALCRTSFTEPDPFGSQYETMIAAIDCICNHYDWSLRTTKIWVDYCSIP